MRLRRLGVVYRLRPSTAVRQFPYRQVQHHRHSGRERAKRSYLLEVCGHVSFVRAFANALIGGGPAGDCAPRRCAGLQGLR